MTIITINRMCICYSTYLFANIQSILQYGIKVWEATYKCVILIKEALEEKGWVFLLIYHLM